MHLNGRTSCLALKTLGSSSEKEKEGEIVSLSGEMWACGTPLDFPVDAHIA